MVFLKGITFGNGFIEENPDLTRTIVYACGSDEMIRDSSKLLIDLGLPEKHFFSDAFVSSEPVLDRLEVKL